MELSGFSFIMRDIRKLIFQLHMLGLAGKFFAVSGEISMPYTHHSELAEVVF